MKKKTNNQASDYIYNQMNPDIVETFSDKQKEEILKCFKKFLKIPTNSLIDSRFGFWFFKKFYVVFFLGFDKRKTKRIKEKSIINKISKIFFLFFIYIIFIISISLIFFSVAYTIKTALGIDIFPDKHLYDWLH